MKKINLFFTIYFICTLVLMVSVGSLIEGTVELNGNILLVNLTLLTWVATKAKLFVRVCHILKKRYVWNDVSMSLEV